MSMHDKSCVELSACVRVLAVAGAMLLAGCHKSGVDLTNASPQQVASQMAGSDLHPEPGRWEAVVKFEKMSMDGVPPQVQAMMQQRMAGQEHHASNCLTPQQAAKPASSFFAPGNHDCLFDHFAMSGGALDARMTCTQQGGKFTATMVGSYSPESYHATVTSDGQTADGRHMSSTMTVDSRHVGACTGTEGRDSQ